MYQKITFNLIGGPQTRYETLDGKQYLVVPTVAITEGVHEGTEGPLLYQEDELGRNPTTWNHRPVVISHPSKDGVGISACSPEIVETQGVGVIYNTDWNNKLSMETWLDETKCQRIEPRLLTDLQAGRSVEVSTGLYNDVDPTPGVWNGESYRGVVKNIIPDHLAILYDQKGACSIADGAGLLRNAAASKTEVEPPSYDDIKEQIRALLKKQPGVGYCYIRDLYPKYAIYEGDMGDSGCYKIAYKVTKGKVTLTGEPEKVRMMTSYVTANRQVLRDMPITHNDGSTATTEMHLLPQPNIDDIAAPLRRQQLDAALKAHYGVQTDDWGGWVTENLGDAVIYFKDGQLFRLPYTYTADKIVFGQQEPEPVKASYTTNEGAVQSPYTANKEPSMANAVKAPVTNAIHQGANELINDPGVIGTAGVTQPGVGDGQARGAAPTRKESVDLMISGGSWGEGDRAFLMGLDGDKFGKISSHVLKGANQTVTPYSYEGIGDRSNVHNAQNPQGNPPVTMQQYIQNAPPGIRDVLNDMAVSHVAEKKGHIATITANKSNKFNPAWLELQSINTLRGIAALAKQPAQTQNGDGAYQGQGGYPSMFTGGDPVTQNGQTQNAGGDQVEVLQLPGWDFSDTKTA